MVTITRQLLTQDMLVYDIDIYYAQANYNVPPTKKNPQQGGSEESCYFNPVDQKL